MEFIVKMTKEYEASVIVDADSAAEACAMISNGDFSKVAEDSYDADMSEEVITSVRVYDPDDEDEPIAEWND